MGSPSRFVLAGVEGKNFSTARIERVVLVVARNHAALNWTLPVLEALRNDQRVQVVFSIPTVSPSQWTSGLRETLQAVGAVTIAWEEAIETTFDLVIAANHLGDLERFDAPLLVLPHGPGYTRDTNRRPGGPVPNGKHGVTVGLGALSQAAHLGVAENDRRLRVVGDPLWDQLYASRSLSDRYRLALGASAEQQVILVTSTWGTDSLLAEHPDIPLRLALELPCDEYRVAVVLHPNIWAAHGDWQVGTWFHRASEAGVNVLSHRSAWRAGLCAADAVIGDHGSVTYYAAMLGIPALRVPGTGDQLLPGTPLVRAYRALAEIDDRAPLRPQIAEAEALPPELRRQLSRESFDQTGVSLDRHAELLYELLDLARPAGRVPDSLVDDRDARATRPRLWSGSAVVADDRVISIGRRAVSMDRQSAGEHLGCLDDVQDPAALQSASVVVSAATFDSDVQARARCLQLADALPGATVTAATGPHHVFLHHRGRGLELCSAVSTNAPPEVVATAVFGHPRSISSTGDREIAFRLGSAKSEVVTLSPVFEDEVS